MSHHQTAEAGAGGAAVDSVGIFRGRGATILALLVIVIGAVAYSNALTGEFVGIDTKRHVRDNEAIQSLWPLWRAMSLHLVDEEAAKSESTLVRRPILSLSLALNHVILGSDARGFQAVNVTIHIAAALVLFGVVRRTLALRGTSPSQADPVAFVVAALWVAHPLNTSSVMHIVQRAESMMGLFTLLTLYGTVRAAQATTSSARRTWRVLAVVACALGMGSKEIMIVVPPLIWMFEAILLEGGFGAALRAHRRFYLALASTWIIFAAFLPFTLEYTAHDFQADRIWPYWLSQPRVILHYLRLVVWPRPLYQYILGRSFWFDPNTASWEEIAPHVVLIAILAGLSVWSIVRRHPIGVVLAFIFVPLLPTSLSATFNVIQEHRMYLSNAAVLLLLVLVVGWSLNRLFTRRWAMRVACVVAAGSISTAIVLTLSRNDDYRSEMTIWAPEDLPVAFTMLSGLALWEGRYGEAEEIFRSLIDLTARAHSGQPLATLGVPARNGLGVALVLQNRLDEAVALFDDAVRREPEYGAAHNNLAAVSLLRGEWAAGREHLRAAIVSDPHPAVAHYNAAVLAVAMHDRAAARRHLKIADEAFPRLANLGERLVEMPISPQQSVRLLPVLAPAEEIHVMRFKIALTAEPMG